MHTCIYAYAKAPMAKPRKPRPPKKARTVDRRSPLGHTSPMTANRNPRITSIAQLKKSLEFWVPLLGLRDWELHVFFVKSKDFGNESVVGYTDLSLDTQKRAKIGVIHPKDFEDDTDAGYNDWEHFDIEYILVHELVHIMLVYVLPYDFFAGHEKNPLNPWMNRDLERAVHQIAMSFIMLHRKSKASTLLSQITKPDDPLGKNASPRAVFKRNRSIDNNKKTSRVVQRRPRKRVQGL